MKTGSQFLPVMAGILLTVASGVSNAQAFKSVITVYGATHSGFVQILGKEFMKEHPGVRVKFLGSATELRFLALLNGETDLVIATRKPTEVERHSAERKGIEWTGAQVGLEQVAVITHPGVGVTKLTVDQLRKIYTGEYKNWRDLGGADLAIMPHSLVYPQDDTATWFFWTVLSKAEFTSGIIWVDAPDFLVRHISVHAGSVAYLSDLQLAKILERQPQWKVRILRLRANDGSPALSPSTDIRKQGDYPLSMPIFLFWDKKNPNAWVEKFVRFCMEGGQEAVNK